MAIFYKFRWFRFLANIAQVSTLGENTIAKITADSPTTGIIIANSSTTSPIQGIKNKLATLPTKNTCG
ncbi:hypothetical protein [Moraxella sp. Pampa]|uniref:hypothetical protein n=1 Tax=Moraxella sp. Pampa TaxID=3111978 RepID=UPI002B41642A|nr:hypothetical protein [Moraxella sp. Pampa]